MKKIVIYGLIICMLVGVSGCSKKNKDEKTIDDYIQLAEYYKTSSEKLEAKVKSLENTLATYDPEFTEIEDLQNPLVLPDGSEARLAVNGNVLLGERINLEPYSRIPDQTKVYLNNSVSLNPSDKWTIQVKSDGLKMEHSTNIYCEIVSYDYVGEYNGTTCYSGIITPFLDKLGIKNPNPKVLFVGDDRAGYHIESTLPVKKTKKGELKVDLSEENKAKVSKYGYDMGVVIYSGKVVVYQFFYEKEGTTDDATKEIINNAIKTICIDNKAINME